MIAPVRARALLLGVALCTLGACATSAAVESSGGMRLGSSSEVTPSPPVDSGDDDDPASPGTSDEPPGTPVEPPAPTTSAPTGGTDPPASPAGVGDALFPDAGNPDLDVTHYDVELTYDPTTDRIAGTVGIELVLTAERDDLTLDIGDDLVIESVELDGSPVGFTPAPPELHIALGRTVAPGSPMRLSVTYGGDPQPASAAFGLDAGWLDTPGGSFVLNEPDAARTWLPSNDHPSDKATWTFSITVPTGQTAVANGELFDQQSTPEGDRWVWEQREPMATYLVLLLTGDYEIVDAPAVGDTEIVHAVLAEDRQAMQSYFDLTDDMIQFFEPLFGRYPLLRYGIAVSDSFQGLAMETQGRSMFSRDDFLFGGGYAAELLLSHELAHQWFGNAVSPARWQDIWLNESFATYGEWLWLAGGDATAVDQIAAGALAQRSFSTAATGDPTAPGLFDWTVYEGGAVVVHALRQVLGDEAFFATLQTWVAYNVGTSRTTDDFIAHVESSNPGFPSTFWDDWLYATDVPDTYPS